MKLLNTLFKIGYPIIHYSVWPLVWLIGVLKLRPKKDTVVYLCNFPNENAGFQYRAHKWAELLNKEGWRSRTLTICKSKSFFDACINQSSHHFWQTYSLIIRIWHLIITLRTETVIVRRELLLYNDYGNLFLDKVLLRIHPKAILDFDDDITAAKNQPKKITSFYGKLMKENGNKFNESLRLYSHFMVASTFLKNRVLHENSNISSDQILVVPTCVHYDLFEPKVYRMDNLFTFGWIGGAYNLSMLDILVEVFNQLKFHYEFKVLIISGEEWNPSTAEFLIENRRWSLKTEIADLRDIDVGIMPLTADPHSKGKGGFKLIQYMGLGIPSIANGITINNEIIDHGVNGFIVNKMADWEKYCKLVMENRLELAVMGERARDKIIGNYSFKSNQKSYIEFITKVCVE